MSLCRFHHPRRRRGRHRARKRAVRGRRVSGRRATDGDPLRRRSPQARPRGRQGGASRPRAGRGRSAIATRKRDRGGTRPWPPGPLRSGRSSARRGRCRRGRAPSAASRTRPFGPAQSSPSSTRRRPISRCKRTRTPDALMPTSRPIASESRPATKRRPMRSVFWVEVREGVAEVDRGRSVGPGRACRAAHDKLADRPAAAAAGHLARLVRRNRHQPRSKPRQIAKVAEPRQAIAHAAWTASSASWRSP